MIYSIDIWIQRGTLPVVERVKRYITNKLVNPYLKPHKNVIHTLIKDLCEQNRQYANLANKRLGALQSRSPQYIQA